MLRCRRFPYSFFVAATLAAVMLLGAPSSDAGNRFAFEPAEARNARAVQYAAMSNALCTAELTERGIPYELVERARGVERPLRFTGPVRGVRYVQTYRTERDPKAPATVLDCRLALAIDDMSQILARYGVVEVEYMSMWRPGHRPPGVRHPSGRAIDVATVKLATGERYSVQHHFYGRVGAQTCGVASAKPRRSHRGAYFWRKVVCELDATRAFNLVLTPNYDFGHRDHLHLEVRSNIRWFLTQ